MKKIFIIIGLLICNIQELQAESVLLQLNDEYSAYHSRLQSDPKSVLNEMLSIPKPKLGYYKAQHDLIISQAYYALVFPERALFYANQGLEHVTEKNQPWLYHRLQLAVSMAHDISGSPSKGLKGANDSLDWAITNHVNDLTIESMTTSGYLFLSMGDYIKSLNVLQQAYQLAKDSDNFSHEEIAGIIALVYEYRRENKLSIPFFIEVAEYHKKKNNWLELSIALYGLGRAHLVTGEVEIGKKELQESAQLSVKVGDFQGEGYALKELAGFAISEGNYEQAENMLLKSLNAFELAKNSLMLFDTYKVLSQLKLKTKHLEKSQEYLEKSMTYIDKDQQPSQYLAIEKQATDILAYKGDFEKAFKDLRKIIIKEKRLISQKSTEQLHQLRTKFELKSKDKENKILSQEIELKNTKLYAQNQKNQVLQLLFVFSVTVIGLLVYIAFRLRKNKRHYENLANFDGLTGVYTRSKSLDLLNTAFNNSQANNHSLCICMIDLDWFKNINDQFGHATGDLVLKELGKIFHEVLSKSDICGRFGGEEFLVGLVNSNMEKSQKTIETIRQEVEHITDKVRLCEERTTI